MSDSEDKYEFSEDDDFDEFDLEGNRVYEFSDTDSSEESSSDSSDSESSSHDPDPVIQTVDTKPQIVEKKKKIVVKKIEESSSDDDSEEEGEELVKYKTLKKMDYFTQLAREKPKYIEFMMMLTKCCANSSRKKWIYNPGFPELDANPTLLDIDVPKSIAIAQSCKRDKKLPFDDLTYRFLVFSCYATPRDADPVRFKECNLFDVPSLLQFKVINTYTREAKFREHKKKLGNETCLLWHGTKTDCGYPIIKVGIKNCSNDSKLRTTGAAYGPGVYTSDQFMTSLGYTNSFLPATSKTNKKIMFVFEVAGKKELYKKAHGIYVIEDDTKLLLKYIFCFDQKYGSELNTKISNYFNKEVYVDMRSKSEKNKQRSQKRIINEFKDIGENLDCIDGDLYKWKAMLVNFDKDSTIYKELQKHNMKGVEIEIRLPELYPFEPPFLRVVKPRFVYKTGHVTVGGSICVDILTSTAWSPSFTMKKLLMTLETLIVDAKIDTSGKSYYTYEESRSAFDRVARFHGWIK